MQLIKYKNALNFKTIKFMAESIEVSFSFNILDTKTVPLGWGKLLERSKSLPHPNGTVFLCFNRVCPNETEIGVDFYENRICKSFNK